MRTLSRSSAGGRRVRAIYGANAILVDRSTDGGNTWSTDVRAVSTHVGFGKDIGCVGMRAQAPAHHLRVGRSGTLYVVYADRIQQRGYDILFTRSTDGGRTWSVPFRLNDDSRKGPAIPADPDRDFQRARRRSHRCDLLRSARRPQRLHVERRRDVERRRA